jgi:hypothetical protein
MSLFKKKKIAVKQNVNQDIFSCVGNNENNNECVLLGQLKKYQDEYKHTNNLIEFYNSNLKQKIENSNLTNIIMCYMKSNYHYIHLDMALKIIDKFLSFEGIETLSKQYKEEKLKYESQCAIGKELNTKIKELKDKLGIN